MKARQLIDGASLGPEALKTIERAFDEALAVVAGSLADDPANLEATRLLLANAILSVANGDSHDAEVLTRAALYSLFGHRFRVSKFADAAGEPPLEDNRSSPS
jgi:hypothetical protein